jgi:predicted nucleic acid-binding Zn ribbon protein
LKKNDPTGVGDILKALKKRTKLGRMLENAQIWEHWPELAGEPLASHARPRTVKDGQLRIEADSAVWMHKFNYHKWKIIKRINRMAGKELVSDVFIELIPDDKQMDGEKPGAEEGPDQA